ncbi:transporter substrate-binding domain-containing protein [Pseudaminobacter manganicus]|uniref:Amino acid ABC transporter n=1 Tax=Manganibacter manganicus TaxID=1873176 RepID=A0A1V8RKB2_9HYPH|nr:amino acid ABC transporter [Pseudaminobacter manganicus]
MLAAAILTVPAVSAAKSGTGPDIPLFWNATERLPKPNLTALPRLRFLTTTDFPPFNFLDSAGRLTGFHVDLARAICAELELAGKCQIQALPWDELDSALQEGEGEAVIAGLAVTAKSREKYAFSRSYLQFPARFVVRKGGQPRQPVFDALKGKKIGVQADTAHERMLRAYFANFDIVTYAEANELYQSLESGKTDAIFGDGMRLSFWLAGDQAKGCCRFAGGPYLAPEYLGTGMAIAVKADNPDLANALNYALQALTAKGTFSELYLRYFPVSFY